MNSTIAMLIAMISGSGGIAGLILVRPYIKNKTDSKKVIYLCNIIDIIGIAIYVSFLICMSCGKHLNSKFEYKEMSIEKITKEIIYFGDNKCRTSEEYVIIEKPDEKYQNIVLKETEHYQLQWIFKFHASYDKYHVYMSEDVYNRFCDGDTIYEKTD